MKHVNTFFNSTVVIDMLMKQGSEGQHSVKAVLAVLVPSEVGLMLKIWHTECPIKGLVHPKMKIKA